MEYIVPFQIIYICYVIYIIIIIEKIIAKHIVFYMNQAELLTHISMDSGEIGPVYLNFSDTTNLSCKVWKMGMRFQLYTSISARHLIKSTIE